MLSELISTSTVRVLSRLVFLGTKETSVHRNVLERAGEGPRLTAMGEEELDGRDGERVEERHVLEPPG